MSKFYAKRNAIVPQQVSVEHLSVLRLETCGKYNLRTFARKISNIDFFLQILPLKDDELVMSKKQKKWWVTDFVLERTCPEEHPKSEKIQFL